MRNLLLADDYSVTDRLICPPPTVHPPTLGELLDVVSERLHAEGVLSLSGAWAEYLEVTRGLEVPPDGAAVAVTSGSWSAHCVDPAGDPWIRWTREGGKYALWTADLDGMEPEARNNPLIAEQPMMTAVRLDTWCRAAGTVWHGTPGMVGNSMLRDGWAPRGHEPRWHLSTPQAHCDRFAGAEAPYGPRQWAREHDGPVHGYDLNRAYLSALSVVELAGDDLHYSVDLPYVSTRAGMWRVELEPWHDTSLPDPAGYGRVLEDGTRWLSSPTMALIARLTEDGIHGGYRVVESWTAPARRITRAWAGQLRDLVNQEADPYLSLAARRVYQQTWGMWARRGRIWRPDWHHAVIGMSRANLWRKIHAAASVGPEDWRRPLYIETDAVYYAADGRPWEDAPHGFKLDPTGQQLGAFKETT